MAPAVSGLSKKTRTRVFTVLVCVFVVVTPLLWLYASGYRFVSVGETSATSTRPFVPTGSLYIGVSGNVSVFVDDEATRGSRFFRNAIYVDGVLSGTHRVVVQGEGLHTWVKELAVASQLVTEAHVLALPTTTTVRVITPRETSDGVPLLTASSTLDAVIVNTYQVASRTSRTTRASATSTAYTALAEQFAVRVGDATSTHATLSGLREVVRGLTDAASTSVAAIRPLDVRGDMELVRSGDDIVAQYIGAVARVPYYFCETGARTDTTCDPRTMIDRQGARVVDALWYPGNADAVLMVREDGVFVTEVDPRGGWQNTQPLVRGAGLRAIVSGSTVYIHDGAAVYQVVE